MWSQFSAQFDAPSVSSGLWPELRSCGVKGESGHYNLSDARKSRV